MLSWMLLLALEGAGAPPAMTTTFDPITDLASADSVDQSIVTLQWTEPTVYSTYNGHLIATDPDSYMVRCSTTPITDAATWASAMTIGTPAAAGADMLEIFDAQPPDWGTLYY